jgi:ABC-2 type transport system ATP-binding protein
MIKAERLTRTYGKVLAVNDVSFEIGPHEIVGLLGHNGAGKTTIMKMITGYLEPSGGSITVNGIDVGAERLAVQKQIGYLPENCPLYPEMMVLDYLEYAAAMHGVPADRIVERIRYVIEKTKLAAVAEKPISTLSRGYKQRLGVAQAILGSPSILILDEPTNGLDPSQILEMRALVKELAETATVVVSTHILQEVQAVCDRVIIINSGRVALDSKIVELQSTHRLKITVDRDPESLSEIVSGVNLHIVDHQAKDGQHSYILDGKGQDLSSKTPDLAKALVERGCKIYAIQPVVRDLETIFGEITGGGRSSAQNGSNGKVPQTSVDSTNTEVAAATPNQL